MNPLSIQPIPYQGSKRSLAPRICQLIPKGIETFYEPFAGSAAITIYAATHNQAEKFVIGDSFGILVDLWEMIIERPGELSERYSEIWQAQHGNPHHFNEVRSAYNNQADPVQLLYLVARCVKNAVRFNKHGHFTQSADKRRTGMKPDKVERTVHTVSKLLKGRVELYKGDFEACINNARPSDFIYMDPPYQGTSSGPDKRYAAQLERDTLIEALHRLDTRNVPYVLSYDGRTGDKVYGDPLPKSVNAHLLEIPAGRSSQATLNGGDALTVESLYVSHGLEIFDMTVPREEQQIRLFA
ncbi:MAG: DNA adenine methylase [Wenzhouxiangella sp.]|nr:DNA adenine methylase [Natronohydrobacter sp.]MCH8479673.1 DNA adenine methylase [Wenzhouxiangella sp.]